MDLANDSHLCRWCCSPYIPSAAASILQPGRVLWQRHTHRTPIWHPIAVIIDWYIWASTRKHPNQANILLALLKSEIFVKPDGHCYRNSLTLLSHWSSYAVSCSEKRNLWCKDATDKILPTTGLLRLRWSAKNGTLMQNFSVSIVMLCISVWSVNY